MEPVCCTKVASYLERINYKGSTKPTVETLRELHRAHMLAVPFENLDIHLGREIVLEEARLYAKIVERRRGGFCYELNGAFAALLRAMGFSVKKLSAGVAEPPEGFGPPFDHMALLVEVPGQEKEPWLADVGFGKGFREPLRLEETGEQVQAFGRYRIVPAEGGEDRIVKVRSTADSDWQPQYRLALQPYYEFADFADRCRYHQTSPQSHFTQKRICSLATTDGRITLTENRLIKSTGEGPRDSRHERHITTEAERTTVLHEQFGLVL